MPIDYLILKVAGKCNLACRYCYYMNGLAQPFRSAMTPATVRELFRKYLEYSVRRKIARVSFAWHGGEPLLAGKEFFRGVLRLQEDLFGGRLCYRNLIQTNATLLDDEWADLLKTGRFSVGVSLDGSPRSHNRDRRDHAGRGSWASACAGMAALRRGGVRFGTMTVMDPRLDGREVFERLYALGVRKMEFNLPVGPPASRRRPPAGAYARFACELFDAWIGKDDPAVEIGTLSSMIRLMVGGRAAHCHSANNCSRYLTVEPNGDVGACENFRVLHPPPYLIGKNILSSSFEEIDEALETHFQQWRINAWPASCRSCSALRACVGGCSAHRYRRGRDFTVANCFCEYYRRLVAHMAERMREEGAGSVAIDAFRRQTCQRKEIN